ISNVLVGEDGAEIFGESDGISGTLEIRLGQQPLRAVTVKADVDWTQPALGTLPIYTNEVFHSFSGDGLAQDWPKINSDVGGGWKVSDSSAVLVPDYSTYDENRWNFYLLGEFGGPNIVFDVPDELAPGLSVGHIVVPEIPVNWLQIPLYHGEVLGS